MCYDYHERLDWIRRMEQMEKEMKEAELARVKAGKKEAEIRQPAPQPDAREEPVPA